MHHWSVVSCLSSTTPASFRYKQSLSPVDMSLQEQLDDVKAQLAKQGTIVAKTAQQLLSMQVSSTKKQLDAIPPPPVVDSTDYATNEDLVQLVGELQGQLNLLEQKSILRTVNSHQKNDTDIVLPLPNLDGDMPDSVIFPHAIIDFKALSDDTVLNLCKFYQLLPVTLEERAAMQAFVEGKTATPHVAEFDPAADEYPPETIDELYTQLVRFIGISHVKRE